MIKITQQDFYIVAKLWYNIFLTWKWWTGKSYAVRKLLEDTPDIKTVIVSPTWIGAINIWWTTIHRAFRLYWDNYHIKNRQTINWKNIQRLIIDEVSMVSCELFDYMSEVIIANTWIEKSFWWIQVICVWDLAQLPPIYNLKDKKTKERYLDLINKFWWVEFNKSKSYADWEFVVINLTENFRTNDDLLLELNNRIRNWDMSAIYEYKSEWYSKRFYNSAVHIMPYNRQVDKFNNDRLSKLPWKTYTFTWSIKWDFDLSTVLTPLQLKLKVWARVMCTKNLDNWLFNWDLWEISYVDNDYIVFKSDRLNQEFNIDLAEWQNIEYDSDWSKIINWTFVQYPLKLAYAITAHKSQWLTLDKVIFHYSKHLSKELVYVAVSRATSYDNLYVLHSTKY